MGDPSARHSRAGLFLNGLLIFKTIYGMSVNLLIFSISKHFQSWISPCWQTPHLYARRLSCPELHWLTVPGKVAWAISIILLLIALIYTLHFIPG